MKYTIDQRMQIMAITDADHVVGVDYLDYVLVTEGHYGAYIKKGNLMIKIKNMIKSADKKINKGTNLDPSYLLQNTKLANLSSHYYLRQGKKDFAIKLCSQIGETAWINYTWLKWFGERIKIRMTDWKSPVYITDLKDNPVGMILPIDTKGEWEDA